MKKTLTLAYLIQKERLCLAMKKRGFGKGNWNGFGGKVEVGETILEAAAREMREESGVVVEVADLEQVALLDFIFLDGTHLEVHAFFARKWEGEPKETEEMKPAWFSYDAIPYEKMWADDPYWLPRALAGEKLRGKVWFEEDGTNIERMEWENVESFG